MFNDNMPSASGTNLEAGETHNLGELHTWQSALFSDFATHCGAVWYCFEDQYTILLFVTCDSEEVEAIFEELCLVVDDRSLTEVFLRKHAGSCFQQEFRCASWDCAVNQAESLNWQSANGGVGSNVLQVSE